MKIMVPVSSIDGAVASCNAGADEMYIGIYDEKWRKQFGDFEEINRMSSFGRKANVTIGECIEIINIIHSYNKKAYITFNSGSYSEREVLYIMNLICEKHLDIADGFIVSDLYLIYQLLGLSYNVVLSTMAGIYNSGMIQFFYDMGIRRMIIPRDVSIQNMQLMVSKFEDVEFEAFIMRNGCKYSDSNCMSYHSRKYGSMCSCIDNQSDNIVFLKERNSIEYKKEVLANNQLFTKVFHKMACGLCFITQLYDMGISTIKVVGRADNEDAVAEDVKTIKKIIDLHANGKDNEIYEHISYMNCWYGLNCYY